MPIKNEKQRTVPKKDGQEEVVVEVLEGNDYYKACEKYRHKVGTKGVYL